MRFSAAAIAVSLLVSIASVEAGKPKPKPKIDTSIRAESNVVNDKAIVSKPTEAKTRYVKAPLDASKADPHKGKVAPKRKGDVLHRVPKEVRRRSHFTEGP